MNSIILLFKHSSKKELKKTTKSVRIYRHLTQTNFTMDWSFIIFLAVWITLQFWVFPKLGIPT